MQTDQSPAKRKRWIGSWRQWMAPVLLGVPMALAIGLWNSIPTLFEQGYFHFHLYHTGFTLLARATDRWAPGIIGFLLLLQWAFLAGRCRPGRAGKALSLVLPLLVTAGTVAGCLLRFPAIRHSLTNDLRKLPGILLPSISHPANLGLLLAVLLIVLAIVRRRRAGSRVVRPPRGQRFRRLAAGILTIGAFLCILAYLGIHLAAYALSATARQALVTRPNIIFIMADTLRADHVGCYGYDLPTTPNIDRLAREGTRFEQAMAPSSWTLWSVSSLMSSQYPETLFPRWIDQSQMLPFASYFPQFYYPKLSEVLRDQGYSTNAVISNLYLKGHAVNTQGYDWYDDRTLAIQPTRATSPAVTQTALRRLPEIKDRKFFLYLVYMDPHTPYLEHPEFPFGDSAHDSERDRLVAAKYPAQRQARRKMLRAYDSDIACTDHAIGQFLDGLKREGLYDDALIVFFSDHGEEFFEHGENGHLKTVYEEVVQVPLIIKFPRQRKGQVVHGTFPLIDLYPSILQYAGIDASSLELQGKAQHIDALLRSPEQPMYAATVEGVQCVRNGSQKYIRTLDAAQLEKNQRAGKYADLPIRRLEAYDLDHDPLEQHNRLPGAEKPTTPLTDLLQAHDVDLLSKEFSSMANLRPIRAHTDAREEHALIERLKSLGYLGGK
ncbi:MAG: sulfatase [Armatimonadota bacterium]